MNLSFERGALIMSWAIALCVVLLGGLGFRDVYQRINRPPPFEFSANRYVAEQTTVCPGQELRWKSSLIIRKAPTVLLVVRTIWSLSLQRTWKPANTSDLFVWTEVDQGKPSSRPGAYTIPLDLPPGTYELRVGATSFVSEAGAYSVPFTVPASCKGA
ncbi:hypothetical protein MF271_16780 [Deinococcus sp. KNUC1210]|uniref:hypothetical protein n=1 Tax=Deinococcus sp. KNUC1210 TaxID=2917691 RepID=UPI001EF0CCD3|nr:hypothetical protein [Deinococcus sp. KNUC1210]ULH15542.1 hypothetical protein MF271_16780 [Deinococcus sp. KNUC1210]